MKTFLEKHTRKVHSTSLEYIHHYNPASLKW